MHVSFSLEFIDFFLNEKVPQVWLIAFISLALVFYPLSLVSI